MYKLIVTDVDGTLLDNRSRVPELNKKAMLACLERGIDVIFATGKSIDTIAPLIEMFGLKLPQITLNGGVIANRGKKILKSTVIGENDYLKLIKAIEDYGSTAISALVDGRVVYQTYHPNMKHIQNAGVNLIKVSSLKHPFFANNTVSVHVPVKETDPCDRYLRNLFSEKLFIVRSGEYFFDFLNKDVNKGKALKEIMDMLNLKKEEVVVFGDSHNDLSMFDVAGLKIAVKNSYPEVIKKADIMTEENFKSGLGKAIFKYIIIKE